MATWHIKHGRWWMIQHQFAGWFSLGVHVDCRRRVHARGGFPYGPYIDVHLGPFILSFGRNCWAAIDGDIQSGRGGLAP